MNKNEKLFQAIEKNDVKKVTDLLRKKFFGLIKPADVNAIQPEFGDTPLMDAARSGHVEIAEILIEQGADINAVNQSSCSTALYLAVLCHKKDIVQLLLTHNVNVNTSDDNPLVKACEDQDLETVTMLLENGADVNLRNQYGDSSLIASINNGADEKLITLLMKHGFRINAKDKKGRTPAIIAVQELEEMSTIKKVLKLLAKFGADLDEKDKKGKSVNHYLYLKENSEKISIIKGYIDDLDLPAPELSFYHPLTEAAMAKLPKMGDIAFNCLVSALEDANTIVQGRIIYILGEMGNKKGIPEIVKQLNSKYGDVQLAALEALYHFIQKEQMAPEVINQIIDASQNSPHLNVREKAAELLSKVEIESKEVPWHYGAKTFDQIAENFIRTQIENGSPDFAGLFNVSKSLTPEEQHGLWVRVAGEFVDRDKQAAIKCYLQALIYDSDPTSVAWGWLDGTMDQEMNILPPDSTKNKQVLKKLMKTWSLNAA